jgi:ribokinase
MIVVVGNPILLATEPRPRAGGIAAGVATAAAAAGGDVQLVGKIGDDPAGEAALLDLAGRGVGHVAILRDPGGATPQAADPAAAEMSVFDEPDDDPASTDPGVEGPVLEAADIELALRYLPDYRVLVVADPLPATSLDVVLAATRWSGAALMVLVRHGSQPPVLVPEATVLEAPDGDPDDAFASVVGAYAAALDRGEEPAEAFATASTAGGWAAVAD